MAAQCPSCQSELPWKTGDKLLRSEECDKCGFDLHSCVLCQFYDPKAYNECRETQAERIIEKEKRNFCDYFQFSGDHNPAQAKSNQLSAAEALFKK